MLNYLKKTNDGNMLNDVESSVRIELDFNISKNKFFTFTIKN